MSSVQLLDKTRKIGKLLHNNNSSKVVFNDICSVLCEILSSNVLVISRKGKVLGVGDAPGVDSLTARIGEQVGGVI
ncbi:MAG: GTP-sensing pleiotropic transcriptional regulator CodY, partial [Lachnospiraceae bacterium]|nr:GTP-sensing pleiotropic transcriptional regulator CodY [Lachnospiraceae bacterium]